MSKPLTEEQHFELVTMARNDDRGYNPYAAALRRLDYLERKVQAADSTIGTLRDLGEEDCPYRDNCPVFGSNHGTCTGCKARRAYAAYDEVQP